VKLTQRCDDDRREEDRGDKDRRRFRQMDKEQRAWLAEVRRLRDEADRKR
jgi:hypothetical protein